VDNPALNTPKKPCKIKQNAIFASSGQPLFFRWIKMCNFCGYVESLSITNPKKQTRKMENGEKKFFIPNYQHSFAHCG
jgi:hypothetical protein